MAERRATIVGTGLIGGSVGLALSEQGWRVSGVDTDAECLAAARDLGAIAGEGWDPGSEITFVATPVRSIPDGVQAALAQTEGVVTDVGSVKASVVAQVDDPRFVGGHPMAGSEQDGIAGASASLFSGSVWVMTPGPSTSDEAFTLARRVAVDLGAEVIALDPARHDRLVAMVSHVPHLTAATLMRLADERATEHAAMLRLAAGGFRDMTRIAAGRPSIWPDICDQNRGAITEVIDQLIAALSEVRSIVGEQRSHELLTVLEQARQARLNLPSRIVQPETVTEVRVPVSDRSGELARITTLAAELDVSIADLEILHSAEGQQGVVILLVERDLAERFRGGLIALGYRPSLRDLQ
jgi:prephenate dehydrogenase